MIAYIYCLSGDIELSKDICQESYLKLLSKPPVLIVGKSLRSWLFRVGRNKFLDHIRKQKYEFAELNENLSCSEKPPDRPMIQFQQKANIQHCLEALPEPLRETVKLRVYEEMNFREISEQMGAPLGTVLWRMQKALKLLKPQFKGMKS